MNGNSRENQVMKEKYVISIKQEIPIYRSGCAPRYFILQFKLFLLDYKIQR